MGRVGAVTSVPPRCGDSDGRLAADRPSRGQREPFGLAQFLSAVLPHALGATGTSGAKLQTASASMPFFSMI